MNGSIEKQQHELMLKARKEMNISGVKDVESFDEQCVVLHTSAGEMTVEGVSLKVGTLDVERGIVALSGRIDAVFYSIEDRQEKKGLFGKLFR